jgi:hypothetical protein
MSVPSDHIPGLTTTVALRHADMDLDAEFHSDCIRNAKALVEQAAERYLELLGYHPGQCANCIYSIRDAMALAESEKP